MTVARAVTHADGHTDAPLIGGRPVPIATHEPRFPIGEHFRRTGLILSESAFLDVVPMRFCAAEPEGPYHVPLVASPWSGQNDRGR
ncbi:hydroxyisourate hydrolase [Methylorubrum sp. SL192]|uniref:hydroxyisourate hydrolase n=1 Tax=Methylorubrum sp. SL192 TaxID=2995167 RepID=UPI0022750A80|nr:hydroxyisourate hydrolase [Methylorubrum sp. SL192]MCY1642699.1 hydroxyisourate hydrolase [Methylorubrum sp. SL192]